MKGKQQQAGDPALHRRRGQRQPALGRADGRDPAAGLRAGLRDRHEECCLRPADRGRAPGALDRQPGAAGGLERRADAPGWPATKTSGPSPRGSPSEVRQQYLLGFAPVGQGRCKISDCRSCPWRNPVPGSFGHAGDIGEPPRAGRKHFFRRCRCSSRRWVSVHAHGRSAPSGDFGLTACATKTYVGRGSLQKQRVDREADQRGRVPGRGDADQGQGSTTRSSTELDNATRAGSRARAAGGQAGRGQVRLFAGSLG